MLHSLYDLTLSDENIKRPFDVTDEEYTVPKFTQRLQKYERQVERQVNPNR